MILDIICRPQSLAETRSLNNPAIPLTAQNLVRYLWGNLSSVSGIPINRENVLGYPAVLRAMNLISDAVASLHCHVYRLGEGGRSKERDVRHPAYRLIRWEADADDHVSAYTVFKAVQAQTLLEGSGYAWIQRNGAAEPTRLVVLDSQQTYPVRINGRLYYWARWQDVEGMSYEKLLPSEDVLHIKGLGYSGLTPLRLIDLLKDAFGLGLAAQRYGGRFFANDASPPIVIEVPYRFGSEEEANKFRQRFMEKHAGYENTGKPAILEMGASIKPLAINNEDAQFLQTRRFELVNIANIFNVPAAMLGDDAKTSFASLEQEYKSLLLHSINPWLENWEQEMWAKLLREREKNSGSHVIKFERKGFAAADIAQRSSFYQMALTRQVMTVNDVREIEDMNPVPWGDEPLPLPNESLPGPQDDDQDEGEEDEPSEPDKDDARLAKLKAVQEAECVNRIEQVMRRLGHAVRRAAKRPRHFTNWLDQYLVSDHYAYALDSLQASCRALRLLDGSTDDPTSGVVDSLFRDLRGDLIDLSTRATYETLPQMADELMAGYERSASRVLRVITGETQ